MRVTLHCQICGMIFYFGVRQRRRREGKKLWCRVSSPSAVVVRSIARWRFRQWSLRFFSITAITRVRPLAFPPWAARRRGSCSHGKRLLLLLPFSFLLRLTDAKLTREPKGSQSRCASSLSGVVVLFTCGEASRSMGTNKIWDTYFGGLGPS